VGAWVTTFAKLQRYHDEQLDEGEAALAPRALHLRQPAREPVKHLSLLLRSCRRPAAVGVQLFLK